MTGDRVASPQNLAVNGDPMSKDIVRIGAAIVALVIVCVTVLAALGKPIDQLISIVNLVVLPLLGAIFYGKLRGVEEKAEQVKQNTNGTNTELLRQNAQTLDKLVELLTRSQPIPPTVEGNGALTEKTAEIKYVRLAV